MLTIRLEAQKTKLIQAILDIDNETVLIKTEAFINKLKRNVRPCQYTVEEVRERLVQGIQDAEAGLGTSQEEMRKKYPLL